MGKMGEAARTRGRRVRENILTFSAHDNNRDSSPRTKHLIKSREARIRGMENAIRTDPGGRGLLNSLHDPLGLGELARAAESLANSERHVLIVTGFYIPAADTPAAETDGPPGAVALATVLRNLEIEVSIITDDRCAGAVRSAMRGGGMDGTLLRIANSPADFQETVTKIWPSHLIAIERLGRTYDVATVEEHWGSDAAREFRERVPSEQWARLLNMRGIPLDEWTTDFSDAFENPPAGTVTIGIGDGGNEIGMGKFRWHEMARRVPETSLPGILTRVGCDHSIIAGTSNWGAVGLAAAVATVRNSPQTFAMITPAIQTTILERMVEHGPAVDGVTRRFEPTVDGLPAEVYQKPFDEIRAFLGIESTDVGGLDAMPSH